MTAEIKTTDIKGRKLRLPECDRRILDIAVPAIISNITVPLLGLIDMAIVGHLGAASYIGAIAVGGMIFNVIYWVFGFLRMATGGLTAQSVGRRDNDESMRMLVRATGIAMAVAAVLIALQKPVCVAALALMSPPEQVTRLATSYFSICINGAPAVLGLFALSGWFIGMQDSRTPMVVAIVQNIVNIIASVVFVYVFGMKIEGVAFGTLTAQYAGLLIALAAALRNDTLRSRLRLWISSSWHADDVRLFFSVSRDIFLRTVCLVSVMLFFTSAGAWQGEIILAVNTLLMQMYMLFSYIMDGFAYAGEALSGKYYGAKDTRALEKVIKRLFVWGGRLALMFTLAYAAGGEAFLALLTDDAGVVEASADYYLWAVAMPVAGMAAFIWDGIYIGCTASRGMLVSMSSAAATFFIVYFGLRGQMANHALWLAFILFLVMRGGMQTVLAGRYTRI
ncbi:MAG: MATE family efflux transporter [Prevotella sp.]